MRLIAILFSAAFIGAPASAQLADNLSRRLEPNALDRAVPPPPSSSATRDSSCRRNVNGRSSRDATLHAHRFRQPRR